VQRILQPRRLGYVPAKRHPRRHPAQKLNTLRIPSVSQYLLKYLSPDLVLLAREQYVPDLFDSQWTFLRQIMRG
jgi:hypothetical protein